MCHTYLRFLQLAARAQRSASVAVRSRYIYGSYIHAYLIEFEGGKTGPTKTGPAGPAAPALSLR